MKKRYLSLLMVAVVSISMVFSGCGKGAIEPVNSTASSTDSGTGTSASSSLQPVKLTMVFPAGSTPKNLPQVQEEMSKLTTEKINATVELVPLDWGSFSDKINLMFASEENIDVMFAASWFGLGQYASKGQFMQLDDLLNKYGKDILSLVDTDVLNGSKVNGKIYGAPTIKEWASDKGIIMRKDLVEKYNFDLSKIKEPKDLEPLFDTIKKNEPNMVPLSCKQSDTLLNTLNNFGYFEYLGTDVGQLDRSNKELKVINMYESPKYMELAKMMAKWNKAGYLNKDAATLQDQKTQLLKAGKAFSYGMSMKPGVENQESRNTGYPMVTVSFTKPYMTTSETQSGMLGIPSTSIDPDRAMMFINMLYTDKALLNLLNWGIENTDYVKVSDNVIDYPSGKDATSVDYNLNQSWMFANQFNSFTWKSEDPDLWNKYKTYNDSAERSPILGFTFSQEPVKTEIAAISSIIKQYDPMVSAGVGDPEKVIAEFVGKMKKAGLDNIIKEQQRQLDEWVITNKK